MADDYLVLNYQTSFYHFNFKNNEAAAFRKTRRTWKLTFRIL